MDRMSKDLEDARQQIKEQKDALAEQKEALAQETEKRQQMETGSKDAQMSLVDLKAEADAIKQQTKGWQQDYASVLAQLTKKMDNFQDQVRAVETQLNSSSKTGAENPPGNSSSATP